MKNDSSLTDRIKPLLKMVLDNKELINMLLSAQDEKKEEKSPPSEKNSESESVMNFINSYFK